MKKIVPLILCGIAALIAFVIYIYSSCFTPDACLESGVRHDNPSEIKRALKRGADPNKGIELDNGILPYIADLARDSEYRALQTIPLLLEAGADINAVDYDGYTALHYAVINDYTELCAFLLKNGANPMIKNKAGDSPYHTAVNVQEMGENGNWHYKKVRSLFIHMNSTESGN